MAEIERVIEELKQLEHCITTSCDETCTYYEDDMYHCHYDVSTEETIDEAIQIIRELQEQKEHCIAKIVIDKEQMQEIVDEKVSEIKKQIPKWHLVADGDLPKDNIKDVLVYLKNGATIQANWSIFGECFRIVCEHGIHEVYEDNPVIAWMELPKFEKMEGETRC